MVRAFSEWTTVRIGEFDCNLENHPFPIITHNLGYSGSGYSDNCLQGFSPEKNLLILKIIGYYDNWLL